MNFTKTLSIQDCLKAKKIYIKILKQSIIFVTTLKKNWSPMKICKPVAYNT